MTTKTQVVYALVASPDDLFLQEIWASVYSLRLYEQDRDVCICCDQATADYISQYPEFTKLVTRQVIIPINDDYDAKLRSREIKTSIRLHISGRFLYVDTDTIFAGTLEYIDSLTCDLAAVPEFHVKFKDTRFREGIIQNVKKIFNIDISDASRWHNSGVIYSADTQLSHEFYKLWNNNWHHSAFEKANSQDQPALIASDKQMGFVINELSSEYNCQVAFSIEHFFNAKIIHYMHFDLLPKPGHPFIDKSIYKQIKADGTITEATAYTIKHCKSAFSTPSAIVDGAAIDFLLSNPGHVFLAVFKRGGILLSLMNKTAALFAKLLRRKGIKAW